jgi:hypothetical protein
MRKVRLVSLNSKILMRKLVEETVSSDHFIWADEGNFNG